MHPITIDYIARARLEELRREAEQYRLSPQRRSEDRGATRMRAAAGRLLIHTGERILPRPTVPTTGCQV